MAFNMILYRTTSPLKKIAKSTPSSTQRTVSITFQDVEDVNAPVVELDNSVFTATGSEVTFYTANYAYIPILERYYFITAKTIVDNDHPVLSLRTDVLKTYASQILGTSAWIERSASGGSWYLPDGLVPMASTLTETRSNTAFFPFNLTPASDKPSYIVRTAGGSIPSQLGDGPAKYVKANFLSPATSVFAYALSRNATIQLADEITSTSHLDHWFDDLTSGIMSLMAFPFEISYTSTDLTPLIIGTTQTTTTSGYPLKKVYHEADLKDDLNANIQIPLPSDFRISTGDYIIRIFLPFVGWQTLDPAVFQMRQYMNVNYKTNLLSGTGVCTVYALSSSSAPSVEGDIIAQYEYVAGLEIPITINTAVEVTKNAIQTAMSSLLAVAGAAVTENPALIGGAITSSALNITRAMTTPVKSGSLGSSSFSSNPLYQQSVLLQYRKRNSPVLDSSTAKSNFATVHGVRMDEMTTVSSQSGFIKCTNWWMDTPSGATETEIRDIKNLMESGVIV